MFGKGQVRKEPVDMNELIAETLRRSNSPDSAMEADGEPVSGLPHTF